MPIFSLFPLGLPATTLQGFSGVLNSTTNSFSRKLKRPLARRSGQTREGLGVAETDPAATRRLARR